MAMGRTDNIVPDCSVIPAKPDMNYEKRRLETFRTWPSNAVIEPQRIAKAGFYSTGNGLEVKCFSCGKCINQWDYGDQVMVKHRTLNPECRFVQNPLECGNVPLLPSIGSQADYRKEADRLASFRGWPVPFISPESLARNGLYYLREGDKVACGFCSVVLHEWQEGDDPLAEHRRASPNCPLLFGYLVGNVPLDHTGSGVREEEEQSPPQPYVEIRPFAGPEGMHASNSSNKALASHPQFGAQVHKPPIHAKYQTYEARLATFSNWPNQHPTPAELAMAGFFYHGMLDHATCFHCNGGLHNWDPADNPWEEHARWFSRCPYVNIIKGSEFIRQAIGKKPPIMPISDIVSPQCNVGGGMDTTGLHDFEANNPPTTPPVAPLEEPSLQNGGEGPTSNVQQNGGEGEIAGQVSGSPVSDVEAAATVAQDNLASGGQVAAALSALTLQDLPASNPENGEGADLVEENRRLTEARLCKVCLDEEVGVVFLPCGHLITCTLCAPNLSQCPMCREKIQAVVRTFFS